MYCMKVLTDDKDVQCGCPQEARYVAAERVNWGPQLGLGTRYAYRCEAHKDDLTDAAPTSVLGGTR